MYFNARSNKMLDQEHIDRLIAESEEMPLEQLINVYKVVKQSIDTYTEQFEQLNRDIEKLSEEIQGLVNERTGGLRLRVGQQTPDEIEKIEAKRELEAEQDEIRINIENAKKVYEITDNQLKERISELKRNCEIQAQPLFETSSAARKHYFDLNDEIRHLEAQDILKSGDLDQTRTSIDSLTKMQENANKVCASLGISLNDAAAIVQSDLLKEFVIELPSVFHEAFVSATKNKELLNTEIHRVGSFIDDLRMYKATLEAEKVREMEKAREMERQSNAETGKGYLNKKEVVEAAAQAQKTGGYQAKAAQAARPKGQGKY